MRFSIITPCLNSAEVIEHCIQSVAEQTVAVEHIVVDGQSTDNSLEIVRSAEANVKIIHEVPAGIYTALNAGILASNGDIVGILHSDDYYVEPDIIEQVAAVFEDETVDACYGDICYVDAADSSKVIRYWHSGDHQAKDFLHGWMPPHPTFFVRRKIYDEFGLYRTDLGTSADYELMLRFLLKHKIKAAYIPKILLNMRSGGLSNVSLIARFKANRMDRRAWRVNSLRPYPWTVLAKPLRKVRQWWIRPEP